MSNFWDKTVLGTHVLHIHSYSERILTMAMSMNDNKPSMAAEAAPIDPGRNWNAAKPGALPSKPWWRRYPMTLAVGVAQTGFAIYLALAYWLNPIPQPQHLIRVPVKVLGVQTFAPHLHVQLEDGTQRMMEFPVMVSFRPKRFDGVKKLEQKKLAGCNGYVEGVPMRFVPDDRFRVWALQCGDIALDFQTSQRDFLLSSSVHKLGYWVYWIGAFLLTAFVFWVELRDQKRRKS